MPAGEAFLSVRFGCQPGLEWPGLGGNTSQSLVGDRAEKEKIYHGASLYLRNGT